MLVTSGWAADTFVHRNEGSSVSRSLLQITSPQSEFLLAVCQSMQRRSKALKHRARTRSIERLVEVRNDLSFEKLEIDFRVSNSGNSPRLSFHVWDDRWVWIDARRGSKDGWVWEWSSQGRVLFEEDPGRSFVSAIENTISVSHCDAGQVSARLDAIWHPWLASGPKETL